MGWCTMRILDIFEVKVRAKDMGEVGGMLTGLAGQLYQDLLLRLLHQVHRILAGGGGGFS